MQDSRLAHKRSEEEGRSAAALAAIRNSIETKEKVAKECLDDIVEMANVMASALQKGRKVVFFGNGGSAADAQHMSAELVGKFKRTRPALRASALTTNTSVLTLASMRSSLARSRRHWSPAMSPSASVRQAAQRTLSEAFRKRERSGQKQ